jgi:RHS repeat-associated protein
MTSCASPTGNQISHQYRYPGQYEDAESQLIANGWRYLIPRTGTYTAPEPLYRSTVARMYGPQAYSYAAGRPLTYIDPDGRQTCASGEGAAQCGAAMGELAAQSAGAAGGGGGAAGASAAGAGAGTAGAGAAGAGTTAAPEVGLGLICFFFPSQCAAALGPSDSAPSPDAAAGPEDGDDVCNDVPAFRKCLKAARNEDDWLKWCATLPSVELRGRCRAKTFDGRVERENMCRFLYIR